MFEIIVKLITDCISNIGYLGVFILMILESMIFPVPSEAVMPFAGYLAKTGRFDLLLLSLIAALAGVIGSLISYYIGLKGGRLFVKKIGKYTLLEEKHLEWTENFFNKYGSKTIFIGRFIPIVRHIISIPAGFAKMNIKKFVIFTFAGAFLWDFFLAYMGFRLGEKWMEVGKYSKIIDVFILVFIIILLVYVIKKIKKVN